MYTHTHTLTHYIEVTPNGDKYIVQHWLKIMACRLAAPRHSLNQCWLDVLGIHLITISQKIRKLRGWTGNVTSINRHSWNSKSLRTYGLASDWIGDRNSSGTSGIINDIMLKLIWRFLISVWHMGNATVCVSNWVNTHIQVSVNGENLANVAKTMPEIHKERILKLK